MKKPDIVVHVKVPRGQVVVPDEMDVRRGRDPALDGQAARDDDERSWLSWYWKHKAGKDDKP